MQNNHFRYSFLLQLILPNDYAFRSCSILHHRRYHCPIKLRFVVYTSPPPPPPPPPTPSTTIFESLHGKMFLTSRVQWEKVGQIYFCPPIFFPSRTPMTRCFLYVCHESSRYIRFDFNASS